MITLFKQNDIRRISYRILLLIKVFFLIFSTITLHGFELEEITIDIDSVYQSATLQIDILLLNPPEATTFDTMNVNDYFLPHHSFREQLIADQKLFSVYKNVASHPSLTHLNRDTLEWIHIVEAHPSISDLILAVVVDLPGNYANNKVDIRKGMIPFERLTRQKKSASITKELLNINVTVKGIKFEQIARNRLSEKTIKFSEKRHQPSWVRNRRKR